MNWSTRLRRWVRIRIPPVREASMKPTAATVLPAPVACSNQNRRLGAGVLGGLVDDVLVDDLAARPSPGAPRRRASSSGSGGSPSSSSSSSASSGARRRSPAPRRPRPPGPLGVAVAARLAVPVPVRLRLLELGRDRGERARERVDLVLVERRAVEQLRLVLGEDALEAEQQRVALPPREARHLGAGLELGEGVVDRPPARRAGSEVGDRLALEQDRLAGEIANPVEVRFAERVGRARGNVSGIGHKTKGAGPARSPIDPGRGSERSKLGGGRLLTGNSPDGINNPPPETCSTYLH